MISSWREWVQRLLGKTGGSTTQKSCQAKSSRGEGSEGNEKEEELKMAIEKTRRELMSSRSFFDSVSEPDMIDHAIYALQATEKKYIYLLKDARERGFQLSLNETLRKNIISGERENDNGV